MDISPLYELRGRLRAAMIAGTNLLSEDFRLKRAAEAFAPMEQASPVFAKIGQMTRTLLSPDQKDREGALLDTITLVDAVLCTQGAVAVGGEVETIQGAGWGSAVTNAPYSVVKTLLDALLTSGGGRYGYVLDVHERQPELFEDYRIKAAMVQALGASYGELADTVAEWLKSEDTSIFPLLQKGFDPKGKKEMVRRIRVMAAIDAQAANAFFVKVLPDSEKEVRQTLIYALRHSPENVDLLLELVKTEKGNAKKMAYYALSSMEDERAEEAFARLYGKKPAEAMEYLAYAETKWASEFVAGKLREDILPLAAEKPDALSKEQALLLDVALSALPGKSGEAVCRVFRRAADFGNRLKSLPDLLYQALYAHPGDGLCELALELYQADGGRKEFFPMAVTAMLLTKEDCCDWLEEQLRKKKSQGMTPLLAKGLGGLMYDARREGYVLRMTPAFYVHPSGEPMPKYWRPVKQEVKGRFTDILMECAEPAIDDVLKQCIDDQDTEYCGRLGDYFYKRAMETEDNRRYLEGLKRCGYSKCEGLARRYFSLHRKRKYSFYEIQRYAAMMPGDGPSKYAEMKQVYEMFRAGKLSMYSSTWDEAQFLDILEDLKNS